MAQHFSLFITLDRVKVCCTCFVLRKLRIKLKVMCWCKFSIPPNKTKFTFLVSQEACAHAQPLTPTALVLNIHNSFIEKFILAMSLRSSPTLVFAAACMPEEGSVT